MSILARELLGMAVSSQPVRVSEPVRFTYDEFVFYSEMHPEGDFELLDGVIYEVAPEGTEHKITRLHIQQYLQQVIDLTKYMVGTEASFPAPGWKEGAKPDNYVALGSLATHAANRTEPAASDMRLVIEITNTANIETNNDLKRKHET